MANQRVECDRCEQQAMFRVGLVASYSDEHVEMTALCVAHFQQIAATETERIVATVALTARPRTLIGN